MNPRGVIDWRRLRSAWREVRIEEETYGSTTSTCKKWKTQRRADEIRSSAEQASHKRAIDQDRPSVAAIDEMLLSGRRDALLELLECRRRLLHEHEALKLKATQATAIRVVSEAVFISLDRLWERTRKQASEQREHLEQRIHAASLKDALAKDVETWDEMSEWLLRMALHVLRNPSESHGHDRRQLAESIRVFLATVSEAVRNSCTGQEATQAITVSQGPGVVGVVGLLSPAAVAVAATMAGLLAAPLAAVVVGGGRGGALLASKWAVGSQPTETKREKVCRSGDCELLSSLLHKFSTQTELQSARSSGRTAKHTHTHTPTVR